MPSVLHSYIETTVSKPGSLIYKIALMIFRSSELLQARTYTSIPHPSVKDTYRKATYGIPATKQLNPRVGTAVEAVGQP